MDNIIIYCNTDSLTNAEHIAEILVENKLTPTVNILPPIKSIYRLKGKVVKASEYTLIIKTQKHLYNKIKEKIEKLHPYELPEIISVNIDQASPEYISWIQQNTIKQ